MKKIQLLITCFLVLTFSGCTDDDRDTSFVNDVPAPSNIEVAYNVVPDNSGLVILTPNGEGAVTFKIDYGDGSGNSTDLSPGESTEHIYTEGIYELGVVATGINGLTTEITQQIPVSFEPPQNLIVVIENDGAISKRVNVTATADFAINYEVTFGEAGNDTPVSANIGETISFPYQEAGIYTISVTAFSAAIETTQYSEDFEVTEILQPLTAAPVPPARAEADVISMFSNAYELDVNVSSWRSDWSTSTLIDFQIEGDDTKSYFDADFVGVEFYGADAVDASNMEFFHIDVWSSNATTFRIKLVDLGGADTEAEIVFEGLPQNEWVSLEIPMSDFIDGGMTATNSIQQLIFSGVPAGTFDFFIDNVYFYNSTPSAPAMAAPTPPARPQSDVITMYSNAYDLDVVVSSWRSDWSTSILTDILIDGNDTKRYEDADFVGVEFYGADAVDATDMEFFHIDIWTPDASLFRLKLVDLGTGSIIEGEIPFPGIQVGGWVSLDIPLEDFADAGIVTNPSNLLTVRNSLQQLIFSGQPVGTFDFFIDNVYFWRESLTIPNVAAPVPTVPSANVISMYSNAYTDDVNESSWRADWSTSTLTDITVAGNDVKEYIDADFVGVEFYDDPVDASVMTFFHIDVWTPNATTFRVKLVDLGTGNPIEGEIAFDDFPLGEWVSLEIPMADFADAGIVTNPSNTLDVRNSLQQLIFSGLPVGTFDFYIDNVYFHN